MIKIRIIIIIMLCTLTSCGSNTSPQLPVMQSTPINPDAKLSLSSATTSNSSSAIQVSNSETQYTPPATSVTTSSISAVCNDGTSSYSQHCSGTCSSHKGVAIWMGILSGCGQ